MQLRPNGGGRGQVIIVAALVIAAVFVGLALVLNSGIYAENLSSRETMDTDGALAFSLATDEAVAEAYERTNAANESSASDARATFNDTIDGWEAVQQRRGAQQGVGVAVERTPHVGWRLEQGADRILESASSADDWTLATGATDVGAFRANVTRDQLHDADSSWSDVNSSFNVRVDDGTDSWRLYVFHNSTHLVVHEGAPGRYTSSDDLPAATTCAVPESRAVIDFRTEELGGTDCSVLNFSDDLSGAVSVEYLNASSAYGTYTVVVNGSSAAETSNFDVPGGADPTAQAVVYSASYASHYGRDELTLDRSGRYMVRGETYAG